MTRLLPLFAFAMILSACGREVTLEQGNIAVRVDQCSAQGQVKEIGETWQCSCNTCRCDSRNGEAYVISTEMACF